MNRILGIDKDGKPFLMIMLEPGNLHRLKTTGDPVLVNLKEYFPDVIPLDLEILVGYSETPVSDAKKFAKYAEKVDDQRTAAMEEKKPHCPECHSTIEVLGAGHYEQATVPFWVIFCPTCGCSLGIHFDSFPANTLPVQ